MKCTKCKCEKEENEFYKSKAKRMSECKECHKERMRNRCEETKSLIYSIVGNSCSICGYNKCESALELHHVNPETKELNLSKARSYKKRSNSERNRKMHISLCKLS